MKRSLIVDVLELTETEILVVISYIIAAEFISFLYLNLTLSTCAPVKGHLRLRGFTLRQIDLE